MFHLKTSIHLHEEKFFCTVIKNKFNGSGTNSGIERIEASGTVYFVTPDQTIRGDRAVYTPGNNLVVMTGDVIVTQGQNVMTGGRLTYNTEPQAVTMAGGAGSNGGRIRGVFYPERSGN